MTRFSCPTCKTILQATAEQAGQIIACPTCKVQMKVPTSVASVAAPSTLGAPGPPPLPPAEWHYMKDGQQQGPVTADQLRVLVAPPDLVWRAGLPQWTAASAVPDLLPSKASPPPPPPPQAVLPTSAVSARIITRPPGLLGSAIGILIVSGPALAFSLFGVLASLAEKGDVLPTHIQRLLICSFIHNACLIYATIQMILRHRYDVAMTAPVLVMASWCWLFMALLGEPPVILAMVGTLGGLGVGVWSLCVLRRPEVRAKFANHTGPLETLLLFKQRVGDRVAVGIAAAFLLILMLWLLWPAPSPLKSLDKLHSRMNRSEVRAILGEPHKIGHDYGEETWSYNPGTDSFLIVVFHDGRLYTVKTAERSFGVGVDKDKGGRR